MTEEYPEKIIECIDTHFPKGDKRRGDALVLQAVAFLEGKEMKLKEVGNVVNDVKDKFAETEVSGYSEGYSSGWIACATLIEQKLGIEVLK